MIKTVQFNEDEIRCLSSGLTAWIKFANERIEKTQRGEERDFYVNLLPKYDAVAEKLTGLKAAVFEAEVDEDEDEDLDEEGQGDID